jgi:hypothetical protein
LNSCEIICYTVVVVVVVLIISSSLPSTTAAAVAKGEVEEGRKLY